MSYVFVTYRKEVGEGTKDATEPSQRKSSNSNSESEQTAAGEDPCNTSCEELKPVYLTL